MGIVNSILFPAPDPPFYRTEQDIKANGRLVFVPHVHEEFYQEWTQDDDLETQLLVNNKFDNRSKFPCYYVPYNEGSSKILMYFHGNAEDIGLCAPSLVKFSRQLKCHVICVEYPGYGVCQAEEKSASEIKRRAFSLFMYLTKVFKYKQEDVFIYGFSIGSGPAIELASRVKPGMLVCQSAYTSIKGVARDVLFLPFYFLFWLLIKERFDSISRIQHVTCPILLIHGKLDNIINFHHSEALYEEATNHKVRCSLKLIDDIDHNYFDMQTDVIEPIKEFMLKNEVNSGVTKSTPPRLRYCELAVFLDSAVV